MLNVAEINLNNLEYNAREIRKKLPKETSFFAVVKADGYGHGAEVVSNALYGYVDGYCVALVEEGIKLRLSGIDKDILILTPCFYQDFSYALEWDFILTVSSLSELKKIAEIADKKGKRVKVHIKYNTGMNRYGSDGIYALKKMIEYCDRNKQIILDGMYSHLPCPDNDKMTKDAIDKFLLAKSLIKGYNNNIKVHISASGGFLKGYYFDAVRIGLLLYGYKPFNDNGIKLKPVMKVYSTVTEVRHVNSGELFLYGDKPLQEDSDTFLIRYGYADGLFRNNVLGQVNNRCMDLTALNGRVKKGRKFCVMADADFIARKYDTISYEILCSVARRAEKIYIR